MPLAMTDAQATGIPVQGSPSPTILEDDEVQLSVPYLSQDPYSDLCWAACCAMVAQALNGCYPGQYPDLPQTICQVASQVLGKNCCPNPAISRCDVTKEVDAVYAQVKLPCTKCSFPFEWEAIEQEIGTAKRPIEIYYEWTKGGSHVALISGYKRSTQELYVLDPLFGQGWTLYKDVLHSYGSGNWTQTYYGIGASLA